MRFGKKAIAAVLMAAMGVSTLAGCVGEKTDSKAANNTVETTAQSSEGAGKEDGTDTTKGSTAAKPESITWMVHTGLNEENGTSQWAEEFERLTGIKMNLNVVSNNEYSQLLELSFASDTVPDVFDLTGVNLAVYAKQNAIADLTDYLAGSRFYNKVDQSLWDAVTLNGRIYGIPAQKASGTVTYVRKDWLDRLGMAVPATYDEFIEMLRRFKEEIPECTVPYTAAGLKASMSLPEFYQGATAEFIKADGQWVDGMAQDNMAQALTNMSEAYKEGLLDTEVVTNTTSNCRDQWYSGTVGAFNYWGGSWAKILTERLQQNVPEAEVIAIPPIEGAVYEARVPMLYCINARLSNEQIASIFKYFFEYMHDGSEGQVLFESGVEGLHWKQEGDHIVQLPTLSNSNEVLQQAWITPWLAISPLESSDKKIELDPVVVSTLDLVDKNARPKNVYPISETLTRIQSDLEALREEILAKVVMGDMTVEEGLQKYKTESEMLNVSKVTEEMNAE